MYPERYSGLSSRLTPAHRRLAVLVPPRRLFSAPRTVITSQQIFDRPLGVIRDRGHECAELCPCPAYRANCQGSCCYKAVTDPADVGRDDVC